MHLAILRMLLLKISPFLIVWLVYLFEVSFSYWLIKTLILPNGKKKTFLCHTLIQLLLHFTAPFYMQCLGLVDYRHYLCSHIWPYYSTKTVHIKAPNDLLPQLSQLLNNNQWSTTSFFLKPTILWTYKIINAFSWICSFFVPFIVFSV